MTKRDVFYSKYDGPNGWIIELDGAVIARHTTQAENEAVAIRMGRLAKRKGGLGRTVLCRKDGTVTGTRSYGLDRG